VVTPGSPLQWWDGYLVAFLLTCVVELPAYLLAFTTLGWCRLRPSPRRPLTVLSALGVGLAVNLITHPLLWTVARELSGPADLLVAELVVAVVEGLLIFVIVQTRRAEDESRASRMRWSMLTAVGVNTLSLLVGLVVLPLLI
jgi:Flp pilus assembly protein protease CpaA